MMKTKLWMLNKSDDEMQLRVLEAEGKQQKKQA